MDVFCGIDWAEDHHDIALVDRDGNLLARQRISDNAAGLARLLACRRISDDAAGLATLLDLAEHGDSAEQPVPAAIKTPRGLLVACLRATGRKVYPINPMAVARYRDRHSVSGGKSDHGDSVVLANVLRTDLTFHRPLPADTELAQAIAVLARAQQDAVWDRTTAHNRLRSCLREYYPGFLAAFEGARGGIMRPEARVILAAAPTPADAARLTLAQLRGHTSLGVLVSIPFIVTDVEAHQGRIRMQVATAAMAVGVVVLVGISYVVAHGNEQLVWLLARGGS